MAGPGAWEMTLAISLIVSFFVAMLVNLRNATVKLRWSRCGPKLVSEIQS